MKKVFLVLLSLLCVHGAFALENWTGNINLGMGLPFYDVTFKSKDSTANGNIDGKGNGVNFAFSEQLIHKQSGFLFEVGLNIGGQKIKDFYQGDDEWGFDFSGYLGLGYAFKHDEKGIISFAALLGYDLMRVTKDVSYLYSGYIYNMELKSNSFAFFIGANLTGVARISKRVGIFGSFLFAVPVAGRETMKGSYRGISYSESYDLEAGGYYIRPSFGLSITID